MLIKNIKLLAGVRQDNLLLRGKQLSKLTCIKNAYLIVQNGLIEAFGEMSEITHRISDFSNQVDASGQTILPAWCDSHTHMVYAGSRENEFVDRINGLTYEEIAKELDCSPGLVKKSLFRAIAKLRERLDVDSEAADYVPCTASQY